MSTKKNAKKHFSMFLALVFCLSAILGGSSASVLAASTSWNFKNSSFKSLGTISSTVTVDDLTLTATSSKTMTVKADSQTVDSTDYTYCLAMGGSGSTSYRNVKIPVSGAATLKVVLKSSGSSSRSLVVADSNGTQLTTLTAGTTASLETYRYTGSAGYLYLYSAESGINLYKIQIDETSSSSSSSDSSTTVSSYASLSDGWYYIKNINSQKYLQVADNNGYDGANVEQGTGSGVAGQKWYLSNQGSGYFTLKNGSGYMLDVYNGVDSDGTNIQLWSSNGLDPQKFKAVQNSSGYYGILTKASSDTKALDVYNFSTSDGGNVCQWTYYENSCQLWVFEATSAPGSSSSSGTADTSDGTVVTSYPDLVTAVAAAEKAGGGKVYVKGTSIDCTGQLALSASNANVSIIGVQNSDGSYPVLDFSSFRSSYIGTSTSDSAVGIRITGSYYNLKNLIVQKAPDNGIQIKGISAGNNTVTDCIVRYNNDAGLQITNGAYSNTIRFVYSYRNCDVYTLGGNADGFAPKLAAGTGNTFYGCYAWENSDDGWDSYDKTDGLTYDLSYEECAVWNNGDPTIFTGEYDFNNGDALDTDLLLVELITAQDSSFATNYANGTFSLPSGKFIKTSSGTISVSTWAGSSYDGNPNGFKFGSVNTTNSCVRTVKNCLSFGHSSKGFDNNNSSCTASFTNCISFDNGYNYYIAPFTLTGFSNILGFSGTNSNKLPSGYSVTTPSSSTQSNIRSTVNATVSTIETNCKNNIIKEVYFDIYD